MDGEGIFWVIAEDSSFDKFSLLHIDASVPFTSVKGDSHTHKNAWVLKDPLFRTHPLYHSHIKGKPYNFYPRGRVELRQKAGKPHAIIWLNPMLNRWEILDAVKNLFGLESMQVKIKEDHSQHYQCEFTTP